jgi:hypothetical protein
MEGDASHRDDLALADVDRETSELAEQALEMCSLEIVATFSGLH